MALEFQNNPSPSLLMVEAADETDPTPDALPAAGQRRLIVGPDHLLYLLDDAGVATAVGGGFSGDAGDVPFTPAGGIAATDVQAAIVEAVTDAATAAATADTALALAIRAPRVTNPAAAFASSATTVAVTTAAFAVGATIVAVVGSLNRTADSIAQTNVTWTLRYSLNGNSQYLTVWTGVVAGSPSGTTATVTLTGSGNQYATIFQLPDDAALTSATLSGSSATAATTALATVTSSTLTPGALYLWVCVSMAAASSYSGLSQGYNPVNAAFGGAARMGVFRASTNVASAWSLSASATSYVIAFVALA